MATSYLAAGAAKSLAAAASPTPLIDWAALAKVAGASAAFGIAVVTVFSLGILALSQIRSAQPVGGPTSGAGTPGQTARMSSGVSYSLAGVCFAFCAAAVLFGLWLVVPQFH